MRDVPSSITNAWLAGDFIGERRPMARVTVQQGLVTLYERGINTFSSIIFDNPNTPVEIPPVKSVSWDRSIDQDAATCTVEIWNTDVLGVGEQPFSPDELDLPGIYTYQLDGAKFGRLPNALAQLLVPDNILRTYEGYGFDASVCPSKDPHLVQTGVWLIDDVSYGLDGVITIQCRDLARILIDQVAYKPVIPDEHYPLRFRSVEPYAGFVPPTVVSNVDFDEQIPEDYEGPTDPPEITAAVAGDGKVTITFQHPDYDGPELPLPSEHQGGQLFRAPTGYFVRFPNGTWYSCDGPGQVNAATYLYGAATNVPASNIGPVAGNLAGKFGGGSQLERYIPEYQPVQFKAYVSNRLMPVFIDEDDTQFTLDGLLNGNLYAVSVAAVWQHFESGVRVTGQRSVAAIVRPNTGGPNVVPNSIAVEGREVSWQHDGTGSIEWTIIQYRGVGTGQAFRRTFTFTSSAAEPTYTVDPFTGDDSIYSWLVFGKQAGKVGQGDVLLAVGGAASLYAPPEAGSPPDTDYVGGGGVGTGDPDQVIPRHTTPVKVTHYTNSNQWAAGFSWNPDQEAAVDAPLDGQQESRWVSKAMPQPHYLVYYEVAVPNVTVAKVRAWLGYRGHMLYLSVLSNGKWVQWNPSDLVPEAPGDPGSSIQTNIPYCWSAGVGTSGPIDMVLQKPVPNVTRVRLTISNLAFLTNDRYFATIQELEVHAPAPPSENVTGTGDTIREAHIVGGAGDNPHTYEDYTDIPKLLAAWGGFFWPQDGKIKHCDGTEDTYNFGQAPFNLGANIDPVLGAEANGRVWGDFEISGVSGVADLPVRQFDKRSLMDGINYIRDILGFVFSVDEEGAIVWRSLNVFRVGNFILNRSTTPGWTLERVVIDERVNLLDYSPTISSRNVRDAVYVATTDGRYGHVVRGFNPNPIGLRRVAGWTDQHFESDLECAVMAQMIAIRQMLTYRTSRLTIPGYPRIQINDQVQIRERISQEDFLHFVSGISSNNNLAEGTWTYDLDTHWLGTDPQNGEWAIDIEQLVEPLKQAVDIRAQAAGLVAVLKEG